MKNCKKITALAVSLMMMISVCMFVGSAEGEETSEQTTVTSTTVVDDLTYVEPEYVTTTVNYYDQLDPTQQSEVSDIGDGLRESVTLWNKIMLRFKSFLENLLEMIEQFTGLSFSL